MWITPWALLLALAWSASLGGAVSRPEPPNWRSGAVRPGIGSSTVHRRSLLQADAAAGTAAAGGAAGNSEAGGRCPQLSKELLQQNAKEGTVMLAVANQHQWDFAENWMQHVANAGITYAVVAASDAATSRRLAALGQPCFEWIDDEIPGLGLNWGEEGWRRMTWSKVFIVDAVVDWGFNLVVSDVDVAWFRDPLPLFAKHPHADLLFSEDGVWSENPPGDDGLELNGGIFHDFNTGVYLLRYSNRTAAWTHAWRAFFPDCTMHDQHCAYELMRKATPAAQRHPQDPRLQGGWDGQLWLGIVPSSIFQSAHSAFLQRLHEVKGVERYAVHLTWTYNGAAGKRARLRDMGLWHDPPEYYAGPSFVTVELDLPEPPPTYNEWNENEDMVAFFLDTVQAQLQQAYVGLALAVASRRAFILPQFQCYCEKLWYGVVRCRVVDAQAMPFPVPCPQDYLFDPAKYADDPGSHGTALEVREASMLANERAPAQIKDSVLIIQPSASLECAACVEEAAAADGTLLLRVPPALRDDALLPLLEPYSSYRVWRLSLAGVGSARRAFGGFASPEAASQLDARVEWMTTEFCCRREEEAPRYHKQDEIVVKLSMTPEFRYSQLA